eukprot:TRINITY_DN3610_c0_g1_i3.p1 TRINITY_DN3610_c0_g1~~TRINITY_DN3610_c0_g1_i3.p1  ORF type:complete len:166 (+),score=27.78 TRINITY_DN3610_c0_g1_i3:75-500(+)
MGVGDDIVNHITQMKTPNKGLLAVLLGIINCFFFGCGVIIGGILDNDLADVIIGLLQLFIPFLGWIWAILWVRALRTTRPLLTREPAGPADDRAWFGLHVMHSPFKRRQRCFTHPPILLPAAPPIGVGGARHGRHNEREGR